MSLIELIAGVEAKQATLTVYNTEPEVRESLAEHFSDRNVRIVGEDTELGPDEFAVLAREGEFVTAVDIDELLPTRDGMRTGEAPSSDGHPANDGSTTDSVIGSGPKRVGRPVLDHLDETLFTSYSRAEMVAASREIEDRAWRVGSGELHAGFQTLDVLGGETETYDRLAAVDGLDVHAYAAAEGDLPAENDYHVHIERAPEIRETWFVAYDGGGFEEAKCALLAEEREPGEFFGFWSYDPTTVDEIIGYLSEQYGSPEPADDDGSKA